MVPVPWWRRLWWRAKRYEGPRLHYHVGDLSNPDDPRGRELGACLDIGIPTGEFDSSFAGPAEYGSWGGAVQVWRWGITVAVRGPIVGHYPPDEDDE